MRSIFVRLLILIGFCFPMAYKAIAMGAVSAPTEPRLALVIHQSDYGGNLSDLRGTRQEAAQIEAALVQTGFDVWREENLTAAALRDVLREFRRALESAGPQAVAFIYYTGHGAQHPVSKLSYLLGTDAELEVASDLTEFGVSLTDQRDNFAAVNAKAVFMVFDACRNTPGFGPFKTSAKGLTPVAAKSDMLIAYSTALGDVAVEGEYAPILAEELIRPGQSAETAFANTQRRVATRTNRRQLPWFNPQIYNTVCFAGCGGPNFTEVGDLVEAMGGMQAMEQRQQVVASRGASRAAEPIAAFPDLCDTLIYARGGVVQDPGGLVRALKSTANDIEAYDVQRRPQGFETCELVRWYSGSGDSHAYTNEYKCQIEGISKGEGGALYSRIKTELLGCGGVNRLSQFSETVANGTQFSLSFSHDALYPYAPRVDLSLYQRSSGERIVLSLKGQSDH